MWTHASSTSEPPGTPRGRCGSCAGVVDELLGLGLHPRRDERRQVQRLAAVEHQAGVQQLVGLLPGIPSAGNSSGRCAFGTPAVHGSVRRGTRSRRAARPCLLLVCRLEPAVGRRRRHTRAGGPDDAPDGCTARPPPHATWPPGQPTDRSGEQLGLLRRELGLGEHTLLSAQRAWSAGRPTLGPLPAVCGRSP